MWILAAVVGLALGIVINVLADVLPPDEQSQPRPPLAPHCRACRTPYPAVHWLALAHWFTQRGRCPTCGAARSGRSPIVEATMGAGGAYLWSWAAGDAGRFSAALIVTFIFATITVIDIEHRLIYGARCGSQLWC
ncbi:MAG: prepilin peptidase [Anaerolineales bacterium]